MEFFRSFLQYQWRVFYFYSQLMFRSNLIFSSYVKKNKIHIFIIYSDFTI